MEIFQPDSTALVSLLPPELEAAAHSMRLGEYVTAAEELRDHIARTEHDSTALIPLRLLAGVYMRMEALEAALDVCSRITQVDTMGVAPELALGLLYYRLGDLESAALHYGNAILRDPADSQAYLGMGWVHLKRRELEEAMSMATAVSERAPDDDLNAILIGRILTAQGFYRNAADSYRRAFRLNVGLRERYGVLLQELVLRHKL
jgi:tetratricopeptide (TPR) repeat protein